MEEVVEVIRGATVTEEGLLGTEPPTKRAFESADASGARGPVFVGGLLISVLGVEAGRVRGSHGGL